MKKLLAALCVFTVFTACTKDEQKITEYSDVQVGIKNVDTNTYLVKTYLGSRKIMDGYFNKDTSAIILPSSIYGSIKTGNVLTFYAENVNRLKTEPNLGSPVEMYLRVNTTRPGTEKDTMLAVRAVKLDSTNKATNETIQFYRANFYYLLP